MLNTLHLRSLLIVGASAAAMSTVASPALAQNVIQELVVTAQKREEALQDVPIAVSAFDQEALQKGKIDGGDNDPFYAAKIVTTRFFADHQLTRADGLAATVIEGAAGALALEESMF